MAKRGRPPKNKYAIAYMTARIGQYLDYYDGPVPILKECCLLNEWNYDYVMELQRKHEELSQSIKKLLDWKEVKLERGALNGSIDKTMAIFSLKQPAHGWTDQRERAQDKESVREIEDLQPLAQMLKNDTDADNTVETV